MGEVELRGPPAPRGGRVTAAWGSSPPASPGVSTPSRPSTAPEAVGPGAWWNSRSGRGSGLEPAATNHVYITDFN